MTKDKLVRAMHDETYTNDLIVESKLDSLNVPHDNNKNGELVDHNVGTKQEKCPRAKILSSDSQIL